MKLVKITRFALITTAIALITSTSFADQIILQGPTEVEDTIITNWRWSGSTWVDGSDKNYGGWNSYASQLWLDGRDARVEGGETKDAQQKILVRFNLDSITPGTTIDSAVLGWYNGWTNAATTDIFQVLKPWEEGDGNHFWDMYAAGSTYGATYNSTDYAGSPEVTWAAPGLQAGTDYAAPAAGTITFGGSASAVRESSDLAALVQGWVDGDYPNYGVLVAMQPTGNSNRAALLKFSEHADVLESPMLTIDYTAAPEVPEPASMTLLALGGIAMLRRRRK